MLVNDISNVYHSIFSLQPDQGLLESLIGKGPISRDMYFWENDETDTVVRLHHVENFIGPTHFFCVLPRALAISKMLEIFVNTPPEKGNTVHIFMSSDQERDKILCATFDPENGNSNWIEEFKPGKALKRGDRVLICGK